MKIVDIAHEEIERDAAALAKIMAFTLEPSPPIEPEPAPLDTIIGVRGQKIIHAILRYSKIEERYGSITSRQSPLAFTLRCVELGAIIPTTHREEPDYDSLPPRETLPELPDHAQLVCDAIIEDGKGDVIANVDVGSLMVQMTLDQRIGWLLGSSTDCERWTAKFIARDKTPALTQMQTAGSVALAVLFSEWP